jgi:hypothetical protein
MQIQQTARNCAGQFWVLSLGEKCQSKNGLVEILSFSFWQAFCEEGLKTTVVMKETS